MGNVLISLSGSRSTGGKVGKHGGEEFCRLLRVDPVPGPRHVFELRFGKRFSDLLMVRHGDVVGVGPAHEQTLPGELRQTIVGEHDPGNIGDKGLVNGVHIDPPTDLPRLGVLTHVHEEPGPQTGVGDAYSQLLVR